MAEHHSARRFYLAERIYHAKLQDDLDLVWRAKQEAEPGNALPATFPLASRLATAGYTTDADLIGADVAELADAGLSKREAESVLSALADLLI